MYYVLYICIVRVMKGVLGRTLRGALTFGLLRSLLMLRSVNAEVVLRLSRHRD